MEDERVIELVDDEGSKERFIFLTTIEHDGRQFAIMTPEEAEDDEEEAIVILELLSPDEGDDMELVSVDDDNLAEAVFAKYMEMVEDEDECDCDECSCDDCKEDEEDK
jgi:uncharacterized protein YrzB (UPF0473 family)